MLPCSSANRPSHNRDVRANCRRDLVGDGACGFTSGVSRSHSAYKGVIQFGALVLLSLAMAIFVHHVFEVVGVTSKPQVGWIHAKRIVPTGAIMQDVRPLGNIPAKQLPRHTMGKLTDGVLMANQSIWFAIRGSVLGSSPEPARIRFFDSRFKILQERFVAWFTERPSRIHMTVCTQSLVVALATSESLVRPPASLNRASFVVGGHHHDLLQILRNIPLFIVGAEYTEIHSYVPCFINSDC